MIQNIVEVYSAKINRIRLNREMTQKEFREIMTNMCVAVRDETIGRNILFNHRLNRKKNLSRKMKEEGDFKSLESGIDDMIEKNKDMWREIRNKYFYFYKDVK